MEKINNKEAIALVISPTLGITVLVSSQIIASNCMSSSLINTGFISLIAVFLTFIVCVLYKKFIGISFLDIVEFVGGKFLKFIVGVIFFIYFLFAASVFLSKAVNTLQIVYYPMTNISYTVLLFVITTAFACNLKNNGFLRAAFLLVPLVFVAVFLIFVGNLKNFNYENIFPVLGHGAYNTFVSGLTNIYTFSGIAYLFFLPQTLKRPDKFMKISIISTILSSINLTLTVATTILMFNKNVTSGQLFPLYIAVRYIEFGTFFQRLDAVFLLVMIIAVCSLLGIYGNLCMQILKEITGISDSKPLTYSFILLIYASTLCIDSYFKLDIIQDNVFKIFYFSVVALGLIILISSNIKKYILNKRSS